MSLMHNKRGLVAGVANDRSIAWGIALALHAQGAHVTLSYQGEHLLKRIKPLAEQIGADMIEVDVSDLSGLERLTEWSKNMSANQPEGTGGIDFVVHAMAYADRDALNGRFIDTSAAAFSEAMLISCHSLIQMCQILEPHMNKGASVLTLTFEGARRTFSNYNVMGAAKAALEASVRYLALDLGKQGVRINALSAGTMKTIAGAAIGAAKQTFSWVNQNAPMGRQPHLEEVGNSAMYLLSDLSSGVTGEIHHVDCGYHSVGSIGTYHRQQETQ